MSATDWVLLAIVVVSALFGLMRGFVGVAASLVAWVLACWTAFHFGGGVALMLARDGDPSAGQLFAGYALSFLAVLLVVGLVGWLVRQAVNSVGLSGVDRALGLALGTVRGAFVASALVLMLGLTSLPRDLEWQRSQVVPVFVPGAQWMRGWLPEWVARQVDFNGELANSVLPAPDNASPGEGLALPVPAGG